ncbi:enoyl-CoA hydratase-related protein [Actinokineospora sp. NBRC 105648]|uniref:enoyl-CoA hydratase/isomerase family protein n=1 Tax=Actinokineospora sp. NBRC 105648 TaxID=3032206 RepID=UPI0024A41242|nr:enoyl-CoA hydratase-related protein [Actinokineospora sp. NBRC 105648]GLZ42882.1 enoyl-CoA hydratase [Actinokineospora sp. NBRC 105648]
MTVHIALFGQVRVLTIDRPAVRNALDNAALRALHEALESAADDPSVRAVVITATGSKAFSAGLDLKALAVDGLPDPSRSPVNLLRGSFPKPVIAAVNGAAVGGGFELVLACDLVVAAPHAVFALPEVSRGIAATEGGTDLPQRVPLPVALEMGLTGAPITAARAFDLGLVNALAEDALTAALGLAGRIAANSPIAVAATKRLMRLSLVGADAQAANRAANLTATAELATGPDAAEGAAAFVEKRAPRWTPA